MDTSILFNYFYIYVFFMHTQCYAPFIYTTFKVCIFIQSISLSSFYLCNLKPFFMHYGDCKLSKYFVHYVPLSCRLIPYFLFQYFTNKSSIKYFLLFHLSQCLIHEARWKNYILLSLIINRYVFIFILRDTCILLMKRNDFYLF